MQPTASDILAAVASQVSLDPARLAPEATLESLDLSSLDIVSALFEIEDRYGIELAPEELADAVTLQDLIDKVRAKGAAA